ncbi:hypothetical protein VTL71DRAFT_12505 [Oculimacula yallundae]|uniref:Heterokaryon incompatibility domain-containing protein n=1 Tax=Oculimacula yallundae TaxID=86028 RepID=A0ABR4CMS3_9HELO
MDVLNDEYQYTPMREGTRRIYKNDGSFPPALSESEDTKDTLYLTASVRNYHMVTSGDIRVLSLFPGLFDDPIRCCLSIEHLKLEPIYDAVSYMWGSSSDTQLITVNKDQAFPVTVSLANALRHLRWPNKVRNLWVDAVCINQSDMKERINQINLMKEIYSRARLSAVWIDVELSLDSDCVQRLLSLREDITLDDIGDDPEFWKPLIPLFQNPYWERLWVQQELVFAPEVEFYCRGVIIPGDKLMAFQLQLFRKSSQRQSLFQIPDEWAMFGKQMGISRSFSRNLGLWRQMLKHKVPVDPFTLMPDNALQKPAAEYHLDPKKWGPSLSNCPIYLLGMLRYVQGLKVTDPRDRVSASLGLVIDYDDDGHSMGYETTLAECYHGIARLLPFKCNSLQFLPQAKLLSTVDGTVEGLPSWAPNWNPPGSASYFWAPFRAAGALEMYGLPFQDDIHEGIFHARGFQYSRVSETLSQKDNSHSPLSVLATLFFSATKSSLRMLARTLTGPSLAEYKLPPWYFSKAEATLYTGILLCYACVTPGLRLRDLIPVDAESYNLPQTSVNVHIRSLQKFKNLYPPTLRTLQFDHLSSSIPTHTDQNQRFQHFLYLATQTMASGCLASTTSGHLAVTEGKAAVEPKDEVWILFGCPTPMVLRRVGQYFKVVSPVYIHEIMNGEVVEGVTTPDDSSGEWETALRTGEWGPRPERPYVSGKGKWMVKVISLC